MAVTTVPIVLAPLASERLDATDRWAVNASSADASGCEEIVAAPGAGLELCVRKLRIAIGAAITVSIGGGETTSAPTKTLIGPLGGAAMFVHLDFPEALVLSPNHALVMDASGAGTVNVYVEGYTRPQTASVSASSSPSASKSSSPSTSKSASKSSSPSASKSASKSTSASATPSASKSSSKSASPSASKSSSTSTSPSGSKSHSASPTPSESPSGTLSASPSASASA